MYNSAEEPQVKETRTARLENIDRSLQYDNVGTLVQDLNPDRRDQFLRTEKGVIHQHERVVHADPYEFIPEKIVQVRSVRLTEVDYDPTGRNFPQAEKWTSVSQEHVYRRSGDGVSLDVTHTTTHSDHAAGLLATVATTDYGPGIPGFNGQPKTETVITVYKSDKDAKTIARMEEIPGLSGTYSLATPVGEWRGEHPNYWQQSDGVELRIHTDKAGNVTKAEKRDLPGLLIKTPTELYIGETYLVRPGDWQEIDPKHAQPDYDTKIKPAIEKLKTEISSLPKGVDLRLPDHSSLSFNEIPREISPLSTFIAPEIAKQL